MPKYILLLVFLLSGFSESAIGQNTPAPSKKPAPKVAAPKVKVNLQLPINKVDFKNYMMAMKQWLGMKSHNNVGMLGNYSKFEDGDSIHLKGMLSRTKNWKVIKTVNYGYLYSRLTYMPKSKATMQTSQAPYKEEEL